MPDDSITGPAMGIGMFLFTAGTILWRKLGRKRAVEDLPELAGALQLEFVPARYAGSQGRIKGSYQGYEVRVDPEESCTILVRFAQPLKIDLRTYEHALRPPFGWVTLYSGDRAFDRYFKTRFVEDALADGLAGSERPQQYLEPFQGRYAQQTQSLTVTSDGVKCQFDFGKPPFIPADAIRTLLPACIELARFIESRLLSGSRVRDGAEFTMASPHRFIG